MLDETLIPEFKPWPKIPRANNLKVAITEKIDGTNAAVIVKDGLVIGAQSRKRLITPDSDNMGFAAWVDTHIDELAGLGDGHHFGEWAGPGIQKNPQNLDRKRFFLFNAGRWLAEGSGKPECCDVVPLLYEGAYCPDAVDITMQSLSAKGDREGYTPEGIILYFPATGTLLKRTFESPDGKWRST